MVLNGRLDKAEGTISRITGDVIEGRVVSVNSPANPVDTTYNVSVVGLGGVLYSLRNVTYSPVFTEMGIVGVTEESGLHSHQIDIVVQMPIPQVDSRVILWSPSKNPTGPWIIVGAIHV